MTGCSNLDLPYVCLHALQKAPFPWLSALATMSFTKKLLVELHARLDPNLLLKIA